MSNQEILEKAITKAVEGGWLPIGMHGNVKNKFEQLMKNYSIEEEGLYSKSSMHPELTAEQIIFNHDFAKALWGEEEWKLVEGEGWVQDKDEVYISGIADVQPAFRMHLQQMVIADDKIEYLGENI